MIGGESRDNERRDAISSEVLFQISSNERAVHVFLKHWFFTLRMDEIFDRMSWGVRLQWRMGV